MKLFNKYLFFVSILIMLNSCSKIDNPQCNLKSVPTLNVLKNIKLGDNLGDVKKKYPRYSRDPSDNVDEYEINKDDYSVPDVYKIELKATGETQEITDITVYYKLEVANLLNFGEFVEQVHKSMKLNGKWNEESYRNRNTTCKVNDNYYQITVGEKDLYEVDGRFLTFTGIDLYFVHLHQDESPAMKQKMRQKRQADSERYEEERKKEKEQYRP